MNEEKECIKWIRDVYMIDRDERNDTNYKWFKKQKFKAPILAETIMERFHFCFGNGEIYCYKDGKYCDGGRDTIERIAQKLLGDESTNAKVNEVYGHILRELSEDTRQLDKDQGILNLQNGILKLDDMELVNHSPDFLSNARFPIDFNPAEKCPRIMKFLSEILTDDCIDLVFEMIGYCLYPSNRFRKSFFLHGKGSNGKSTLLDLISAFLGRKNVARQSIQELSHNKFRVVKLVGKVANIHSDLGVGAIKDSDIFKNLSTGDEIAVEEKHKPSFDFKNKATLIFACNQLPKTHDKTKGFYERLTIIPFLNSFPPGKADPYLIDKLTTAQEMSGLLNLAIAGLQRLLERERFSEPKIVGDELTKYRSADDPLQLFIKEECQLVRDAETKHDSRISKDELYRMYNCWCSNSGYHPLGKAKFYSHLCSSYPSIKEGRLAASNARAFIGIKALNHEDAICDFEVNVDDSTTKEASSYVN